MEEAARVAERVGTADRRRVLPPQARDVEHLGRAHRRVAAAVRRERAALARLGVVVELHLADEQHARDRAREILAQLGRDVDQPEQLPP